LSLDDPRETLGTYRRESGPLMATLTASPEDLWLRRDRETEQAWEAFEVYRELGLGRSIVKA